MAFPFYYMLVLEALVLALVLLLVVSKPRPVIAALDGMSTALGSAAAHPALAIAVPGLLLLLGRLALLPVMPFARTVGRDESSMVLAAETMLRGRLAMPPHAMPEFFESVYVNHVDAYGSIYFPGRTLEIMLGVGVFGIPNLGTLIVAALAASAITWALRGWVSPKWALAGGLLFVFRFGLFSNVVNQPVGLAGMVLGGALLIGSYGRLRDAITPGPVLALALGLFLTAIARPFEGFLFALPLAIGLLIRQRHALFLRPGRQTVLLFGPVLTAVALAVIVLGAFNHAGTGSAARAPYDLNREAYAGTPAFWVQEAAPATRDLPAPLALFYQAEGQRYFSMQETPGLVRAMTGKVGYLWSYYVGVLFLVPFLAGLWSLRRVPEVPAALVLFFAGFSLLQFSWPHYGLPLLGAVLVITFRGLERLNSGGRGPRLFARLLVPASFLLLLVPGWFLATGQAIALRTGLHACCYLDSPEERSLLAEQISDLPGRHIIFVGSRPDDPPFTQWVFNGADLYDAPILWVNDLGHEENRHLIAAYPDRRYWHLEGVNADRLSALGPDGQPLEGEELVIEFRQAGLGGS